MPTILWKAEFSNKGVPPEAAWQVFKETARSLHVPVAPPREVWNRVKHAETSALHPLLEWDKEKGWEEHNIQLIREIAGALVVEVKHTDGRVEQVRNVLNVKVTTSTETTVQGYMETEDIIKDPALKEQVVSNALRDLREWKRKYLIYLRLIPDLRRQARMVIDDDIEDPHSGG